MTMTADEIIRTMGLDHEFTSYDEFSTIADSFTINPYVLPNDVKAMVARGVEKTRFLRIKNVIFNPPATIVFWNDGTKTVVKAKNEAFDWEKGLAMAICKKYLADGKGRYYDIFRKYEEVGIEAEYKEAMKSIATRISGYDDHAKNQHGV